MFGKKVDRNVKEGQTDRDFKLKYHIKAVLKFISILVQSQ